MNPLIPRLACALILVSGLTGAAARAQDQDQAVTLRVATLEVGSIPTRELLRDDSPRLRRIAEIIQRIRPNVLLLSGIAYDTPGGPDVKDGDEPGRNGQRLSDLYLAHPQAEGLAPLKFKSYMAPVNSGMASGMDLDHDGRIVTAFPPLGSTSPNAAADAAAYSGDCWGPGVYPGQLGMALLVDERLAIQADKARTFRKMPWDYMLGSLIPSGEKGKCWYADNERLLARLSSTSHWDVPVALPNGAVIHFLCSRPVTPTGEGPPRFASRRNHDEIRFWADYIEDAGYIVDDANAPGGLDSGVSFVVLGDLGRAPDPKAADSDVIGTALFGARGVNHQVTPTADVEISGLSPDATTLRNLRSDYVLPSKDLGIAAAGVWRHPPEGPDPTFPSDHFPVWMELVVRAPAVVPKPERSPKP